MNKTHRIVWSQSRQTYVVASEAAKAHGKPSSAVKVVAESVMAAMLALAGTNAYAVGGNLCDNTHYPLSGASFTGTGPYSFNVTGAAPSFASCTFANNGDTLNVSGAIAFTSGNAVALFGNRTVGGISNTGTISTDAGVGVFINTASTLAGNLVNSGLIHGGGGSGVGVAVYLWTGGSTITGTLSNTGTISGGQYGFLVDGGTIGSIVNSGTITAPDAALVINTNATITGGITNTGVLAGDVRLGKSTLYLNGTSGRVTGTITGMPSAKIYVNGTFTSEAPIDVGHFEINPGGVFNMAHNVGISAPATFINSGVLAVAATNTVSITEHNYVQNAGGTFRTHVTNDTTYGKLVVAETATLPSDAKIDVNVADRNFRFTATSLANIISAGTLVSDGTFSVTDNSLLFNFGAVKDGNTVDLTITPAPMVLTSVNNMGNTPAVDAATVLDTIIAADPTGPIGSLFVGFSTEQQVSNAVTQTLPLLTGGNQVAASAALTGINRVIQARIESNRGLSSGDGFYGDKKLWMKPFGSWADQDNRNGVSGFEAKTAGLAFGADATVSDKTRLGLSFAYAKAGVDGNSKIAPNSANVDVYQLVGYGSHSLEADKELNFQVGIGQNQNHGKRDLLAFGTRAKGDFKSLTATAGIGYGQTFKLSEQTGFTPSVRADYTWIKDDGYTEKGAGALNLRVKGRDTDELILAVDGKLTHEIAKGTTVTANLGLGYDALNRESSITAAYTGAPTAAFTTKGLDPSPWLVRGGLGVVSNTQGGMEVSARYDVEHREDFLNQTASVKVRWAF